MWSLIQDFLDTSGIHGLNYIHPRNSIISRIFGIICVVLGFTTAGFFLKGAFEDWEETPVMTTLDSIAAPITMIQFPTVTICQDEYKPPDNWAFLETILNNLAFECSDNNDECKETVKLRKDFDSLIKPVVDMFKGWLMNPLYETTTVYDILVNRTWNSHADGQRNIVINYLEGQILSLMEKNKISITTIIDFISTNKFAKRNHVPSELKSLSEDIDSDYDYDSPFLAQTDPFDCSTQKCKINAKFLDMAVRFLFVVQNIEPKLPFGSFFASFAHISDEFLCFEPKESISKPKIFNHQDILSSIELDCKEIEMKKYKMHGYFEQLSKIAGFSENELVSLYDLPALLATSNLSTLLAPSFSQAFLYSRCRGMSEWEQNEIRRGIEDCSFSWNHFAKNPSGHNVCVNRHNDSSSKMNDICCKHQLTKRMGNNLSAVMKVMRIVIGRGKSKLNKKELFQMSKPYLNYSLNEDEKHFEENPYDTDLNTIIPWCEIKDEKEGLRNVYGGKDFSIESCDLFHPIVTDIGICHSFNTNSTMNMLRESYFIEAFNEAFNSDLPTDIKMKMGVGSGPEHALNFHLMGNAFHRKLNDRTSWYMGISDQNNYFDMNSIGKQIKPGYHMIWKVQAMEIVPTEDLRNVPVDKRKCRFDDENDGLNIFEKYSQTACEFECRIKQANSVCGCYPWYVPTLPKLTRHTICDVYGNFCFKEMMKKVYHECLRDCTPNCHQIEFTYTQEQILRDPETICTKYWKYDRGHSLENKIAREIIEKGYYNSLIFKYSKIYEWVKLYENTNKNKDFNETIDQWNEMKMEVELCKILVKNHMAEVSIMFDRKKYVRTLTSIKATFNDKLANFGGTLGLFTGMSILSMIEIVFWISKCFLNFLRPLAPQEWNPA